MRKYESTALPLMRALALFCLASLVIALALTVLDWGSASIKGLFWFFGGMGVMLFIPCYFAEKSRYLLIDSEKITLTFGSMRLLPNGKGKLMTKRLTLPFCEISHIDVEFYEVQTLHAKPTNFYVFTLKNGERYRVTLYSYGKEAVKEILGILRENGVGVTLT